MQIELSRNERRLLLQGLWKEQQAYKNMLDSQSFGQFALEHISSSLDTLDKLELKLINGD
jgi:hypothetical protein